ncbi:MAG TPA: DUF1800 domain-containing protein [Bryobacteraceae bacterium]|nr:DUF1800 domain-containing protein [Bryobacteraceae bacterium]
MRRSAISLIFAGCCVFLPASAQTVTVSPAAASVHLGTFYQFAAKVAGISPTTVGWTVALPPDVTGSPGTISAGGRYTPPAAMPSTGTVIITATSTAAPAVSASAMVTLVNPYPTLASVYPANVAVGPFTLIMNGSGFVPGAQVLFGGVPLATTYWSATRLMATGTADQAQSGQQVPLAVMNPDPGAETSVDVVSLLIGTPATGNMVTYNVAARFLDQAAFGPDAVTSAHVQAVGLEAYLNEQFAAPISPYPDPDATGFGIGQVQARFFTNAVHGTDQLRQRVAFALGQIFVASAVEENTPAQLVPYLQLLKNDAFANFRTLMEDVTLSPTMGEYLDMRNNDKADPAKDTRANENYARELMQLFTIGLFQLNQDGTLQLDSGGNPIPTYDQTTIQNFAKVYTGWTYPTRPGATPRKHNPPYYIGPMVPDESNHDTTSKTLLNGLVVPAGGTAESDLKAALDDIFNHPNVAPFIGKQLIQHLVTSNPSPAYVGRIAAVFNDNGAGVRGDLQAVVKAILLDPEARAGDEGPSLSPPDTSGHLREPVFAVASILRGLGATVNDTNNLSNRAANLGQTLFAPPTVFNYFAPGYTIPAEFTPGATLLGPEFQLQSPSAAVARANMVNAMLYGNLGDGAIIDWTYLAGLAATPEALLDSVSDALMHGKMPDAMRTQILSAVNAFTGTTAAVYKARAQAAVYLTVSSSYYNVEH